jgi:hypothetical protein
MGMYGLHMIFLEFKLLFSCTCIIVWHVCNLLLLCVALKLWVSICVSIVYVILLIKLFVNILLFIVQYDLNKIQINPTKVLNFFPTKIRFPLKTAKFGRETAKFGQEMRNSNFWICKHKPFEKCEIQTKFGYFPFSETGVIQLKRYMWPCARPRSEMQPHPSLLMNTLEALMLPWTNLTLLSVWICASPLASPRAIFHLVSQSLLSHLPWKELR